MNWKQIASLLFSLIFCLAGVNSAHGANLEWKDLTPFIPQTVLDETTNYTVLSFTASRGSEWLVGNPNQLFQVTSQEKIFDLTPDLKKFGFQKIRQVASDGQNWLVIGDSGPWFSQPDLAFRYDGMYWKNVSFIMTALPPQEWVEQVTGKKGLWIIPTNRSVYIWHSALNDLITINLPEELISNGVIYFDFYSVQNGWIVKTLNNSGYNYYYFDGQNFNLINNKINLKQNTCIASNGVASLAISSEITNKESRLIKAGYFDGYKFLQLDKLFKPLENSLTNFDWQNSHIVWDGKSWLIINKDRRMASFNGRDKITILNNTRDYFINSGYGLDGTSLHAGYAIDINNNRMTPRLVMTRE